RAAGNLAVMGGVTASLVGNFAWSSSPFEGGGQMTFVIQAPGLHTISVARSEDGTFVDKFVITTDSNFNPTTGFSAFGPPVTLRQGEPSAVGATVEITSHP